MEAIEIYPGRGRRVARGGRARLLPADLRVVVRRGHDQRDGAQDRVSGQAEEQDRGQGHGRRSPRRDGQGRDARPEGAAGREARGWDASPLVQWEIQRIKRAAVPGHSSQGCRPSRGITAIPANASAGARPDPSRPIDARAGERATRDAGGPMAWSRRTTIQRPRAWALTGVYRELSRRRRRCRGSRRRRLALAERRGRGMGGLGATREDAAASAGWRGSLGTG